LVLVEADTKKIAFARGTRLIDDFVTDSLKEVATTPLLLELINLLIEKEERKGTYNTTFYEHHTQLKQLKNKIMGD
jgi:hypothetical protein